MKKLSLSILLVLILLLALIPTLAGCNKNKNDSSEEVVGQELVIYNWEDYIDSDVLDDFSAYYEEKTGQSLSITYTTFDTNETMMTKVLKGDCNVDLICPSEYSIQKLLMANCLLSQYEIYNEIKPTLDKYDIKLEGMSSLREGDGSIEPGIIAKIKSTFSSITANDGNTYSMTDFMVPYFWGTLGLLYNVNHVTIEELEEYGWGVLWNKENNKDIENMILMKDSVRDTYAAAIFYMYEYELLPQEYMSKPIDELINCTDSEVVDLAEKYLTEQRDHISGYEVDFGKDDMLNEIVYVDFAWSGDALWAIEESYDEKTEEYLLDYYVPESCSNIWFDGWVIPTSVKNKLAAMMFIDYCCNPEIAIRNSMEVGYTSSVSKDVLSNNTWVQEFLEENEYLLEDDVGEETGEVYEYSYFNDIRRYPDVTSDKLGMMQDFGNRNDYVIQMWSRAKSGRTVDYNLFIVIGATIGAILLVLMIYYITRLYKLKPKKRK